MSNKYKIPDHLSEFINENARENCCQCGFRFDQMNIKTAISNCPQCGSSILMITSNIVARYLLLTVPIESKCSW